MPKAQLSSAEKSRKEKVNRRRKAKTVKSVVWSDEQIRQREKDAKVRERFKALG